MLLNSYRNIYKTQADLLKEWKNLTKSELCFLYIENKDIDSEKANLYLSGLIYRVLGRSINYYNGQIFKLLSEEDVYDITIQSILYVIDKQVWLNEDSTLFSNKNAPEIAINMRMKTQLMNARCAKNRYKRKLNNELLSLDALEEESSDGYFIPIEDKSVDFSIYFKDVVRQYFLKEEYLQAFVLDSIVNSNSFTKTTEKQKFSFGKLKSSILNISDDYCKIFSNEYNLDLKDVKVSLMKVKNMNSSAIDISIRRFFKILKRDKDFSLMVHNAY